jgi:hypothetical protein
MNTCPICIENFNKVSRAKVVCICNFEACRVCVKQYLLNQPEEPHCMSCKLKWNRKFLTTYFEKNFILKDLKTHRENILYQRELGFMPETQPYLEQQKEINDIQQEKREIDQKIRELQERRANLDDRLFNVSTRRIVQRREFIRQCPNGECRGFLTASLKCKICDISACGDCREPKGITKEECDSHICKEEILESIKVMERDSKNCPKCSALIFKINGCNVMWCTQCHTSFNWRTLQIEKGIIHNPEYFDWIRRTGGVVARTEGDVQCGRELDTYFVSRCSENTQFSKRRSLFELIRNVNHIAAVEMMRFGGPVHARTAFDANRDLRIRWMLNEIAVNQFKSLLQKRQKDREKKSEIHDVLQLFTQCTTELFYRLLDSLSTKKSKGELDEIFKTFNTELTVLREHCNNCFESISKVFNCKRYVIDESLNYL